MATTIKVNGVDRTVDVDSDTPLLWVSRRYTAKHSTTATNNAPMSNYASASTWVSFASTTRS
jgi:aerobic-type carbon monoxide dehydrogenase small subunit (CoxS/CutS family)